MASIGLDDCQPQPLCRGLASGCNGEGWLTGSLMDPVELNEWGFSLLHAAAGEHCIWLSGGMFRACVQQCGMYPQLVDGCNG